SIEIRRNARKALTLNRVISRTRMPMQRRTIRIDMSPPGLEFIRYLDDPNNDLMRITVGVNQAELHHWVVFAEVILDVCDLVVQQMFLDLIAEYLQCICKVYFERTGIVVRCLHAAFVTTGSVQRPT